MYKKDAKEIDMTNARGSNNESWLVKDYISVLAVYANKNNLKTSSFVVNIAQVGPIRNMENKWGSKRLTYCSLTILPSFTSLSANNNLLFCSLLKDIV